MSVYLTFLILSVVFLIFVAFLLRKGSIKEGFAILWLGSSTVVVVLALFPEITKKFSKYAGVELPSNFVFSIAILLLVTVSLVITHEIGKLQDKVQSLAQEMAILRNKIEK
jgi:hypothetical protein